MEALSMKKVLLLFFVGLTILSLSACGGSKETNSGISEVTSSEVKNSKGTINEPKETQSNALNTDDKRSIEEVGKANKDIDNVGTSDTSNDFMHSETSKNTSEIVYPRITKEFLEGKSWYEGASRNLEQQPRYGFKHHKFQTPMANNINLDYDIVVDDEDKTYKVYDFRKDNVAEVNLRTRIKTNLQDLHSKKFHEANFYLYYYNDGQLMIARERNESEVKFESYPLEDIDIWN